jgi:hypothetical protein
MKWKHEKIIEFLVMSDSEASDTFFAFAFSFVAAYYNSPPLTQLYDLSLLQIMSTS